MKKVLNVKDIQDILGVCDKTAYGLIRQAIATGMFKVIKIGRLYKVPTNSFLNWLDEQE